MLKYTKAQRAHLSLIIEDVEEVMRADYVSHIISDVDGVLNDIQDHSEVVNVNQHMIVINAETIDRLNAKRAINNHQSFMVDYDSEEGIYDLK